MKQNPINHIALVLDASPSMQHLVDTVIKVADDQIKFLAERSQQLDMETRVTVYSFADPDMIECLFYDMDVLRLPSLKGLYNVKGRSTALIDAAVKSQLDLGKTATLYGDHAFLTFLLTDGEENSSVNRGSVLTSLLAAQSDNETMAVLVPDQRSKIRCQDLGFHKSNVAVWDATTKQGMEDAGHTIRAATDAYMTSRSGGVTTKTGIFTMDASAVNHRTVAAKLKELTGFRVEHVKQPAVIKEFIDSLRPKVPFVQGANYFPLIKRERINDSKEVVIRHKVSGKIYGGPQARTLVGLPDTGEVSVSPQPNNEYDVFVQSTSLNRKLIPGHDLLIKV